MLKKVIEKITATSVKYRKGFFEIGFNGNSPEEIVNSSSFFNFFKHNKKEQYIKSKTFFFNVFLNYYKITDDLWLLYTETVFKKNVKLISKYNKANGLATEYYNLMLSVNTDSTDLKIFSQHETYTATKYFWGFFKPTNSIESFNYKNSEAKYITISFTRDWLNQNFRHQLNKKGSQFNEFLISDKTFLVCAELNENLKSLFDEAAFEFQDFREHKTMNVIQIQRLMFQLINSFLERIDVELPSQKKINITDEQRNLMLKIERHLQNNLDKKFEGINFITHKFNISETALKINFKQILGTSVYQYFNKHQMLLANQLLKEDDYSIKEIAFKFGYESPGKFTEAFKKQVGYLPSEASRHI